MSVLVLTFSGTYLELAGWILIGLTYLALAFVAGWFIRGIRDDS